MKIYGLEKLSMVDYEGHLCATVFTAGCNFRCPFCHNSDLVNISTPPIMTEDEFFAFLDKRKGLLDSVCVSGGEPCLQSDLVQFITKIKEKGYLVKLDTNGTKFDLLKQLVESKLVDYVAMDIKNDQENYSKTAGGNNFNFEDIKKSVQFLKKGHVPYEFRTTLVKGFHTLAEIEKMAIWLKGSERLYLQCFVDSGRCLQSGLAKVDKTEAQQFQQVLSKTIKNVCLRGY